MIWRTQVKQLIGFALGTLWSIGAVTSASAEGTRVAEPVLLPDAGIEVIVVTARRPAAQPASTYEPIEEIVVTAKRPTKTNQERTPPAMPIVIAMPIAMPKLELAVAERPVFRL
jgi:hypothetical protein